MTNENFNVGDIVCDKHWKVHSLIVEYDEQENLVVLLCLKYDDYRVWSVQAFKDRHYKVS